MASNPTKLTFLENDQQLRDLVSDFENARVDAENFASATGSFTDADGNTFQKGAKGWAEESKEAAASSQGIDGFIESGKDENDLPSPPSDYTDQRWVVANDSQGRANAIYKSDGSSWNYTGISLVTQSFASDASNLETGKVSNDRLPDKRNPLSPNLDIKPLTNQDGKWRSHADIVVTDTDWLISFIEGSGHNNTDGVLKVVRTENGGANYDNEVTVFSDNSIAARDSRMTIMNSGRIGIIFVREDSNGLLGIGFAYSDDKGFTWTVDSYDNLSGSYPSFSITDFPTSASLGGASSGYVSFLDNTIDGNGDKIFAFYTTDNGDTWTETEVINESNAGMEVSVKQLANDDRWIMITRDGISGTGQPKVYKSTDLENWDGSYKADGQKVKGNPSSLLYWNGYLTWVAVSRPQDPYSSKNIPVDGQRVEGIVSRTKKGDDVWNDPATWGDFSIQEHIPNPHYDAGYYKRNKTLYGVLGMNERLPNGFSNKGWARLGVFSSTERKSGVTDVNKVDRGDDITRDSKVLARGLSADLNLNSGTWEIVKFSETRRDINGEYDTSTGIFVPEYQGVYQVSAHVTFTLGADSDKRAIRLRDATNDSVIILKEYEGEAPITLNFSVGWNLGVVDWVIEAINRNNSDTIDAARHKTKASYVRIVGFPQFNDQ